MDLLSLDATNVCSFEHLPLSLHRQGLVWLGGANEDTDGAKSNGAGKSNVYKIIAWTLYGETIDEDDPDKIIRRGTKCARSVIEAVDGETRWRVERERRKNAPRLYLFRDDVKQEGSRVELQLRLNELLGLDFQAFRNTSLYGQRDLKRFVEPSVTDAQRKDVLQRILRTNVYGVCHAWIKEQLAELRVQANELSTVIGTTNARLEELDVGSLEAEVTAWNDERRSRVIEARERSRALLVEWRTLRGAAPDVTRIEAALMKLRADRASAAKVADGIEASEADVSSRQDEVNTATVNERTAQRAASEAEARLTALEGESKCPTCGDDLTDGRGAMHVDGLRAHFGVESEEWEHASELATAARASLTEAQERRDVARRAQRSLRRFDDEIAVKRDALAEARAYDERVGGVFTAAHDALNEAKAILAESNPHDARLGAARARVGELTAIVDAKQRELDDVERQRAHYEFWSRGFGPTGMPSFALDKWMPYLTERANHYLEVLADGDITMTFSTQRELKTKGEFRDQLSIAWSIEGVDDYPPSGGQFKKMSLATDFALMDLASSREGASLDLLCLDECLDGLDVEGRQRVLHLLHSLRSRRGTIFVISQETDVAEVFERALQVTKTAGVSRLEAVI